MTAILEHFNYHCFGQARGPVPTIRLCALLSCIRKIRTTKNHIGTTMAKKRKTNNPRRSKSTARARRVAREEARARRSVSSVARASGRDELRDKRRLAQSPSSQERASGRELTRRDVWGVFALGLAVGVCYLPVTGPGDRSPRAKFICVHPRLLFSLKISAYLRVYWAECLWVGRG